MKLATKMYVGNFLCSVALDIALAFLVSHYFLKDEPYGFWLALGAIWVLATVVGFRRLLYRAATLYFGHNLHIEQYRRIFSDAGIPAPQAYDVDAGNYLHHIAQDPEQPLAVRRSATVLVTELNCVQPYAGFLAGMATQQAAGAALNKLRRA